MDKKDEKLPKSEIEKAEQTKLPKSEIEKAEQTYPGVAINEADDDADTKELVKERTCTLNNNPRNEGKPV